MDEKVKVPKSVKPREQQPSQANIVEGTIVARTANAHFVVCLDDGRTLQNCFISAVGYRTLPNSVMPKAGERVRVEVSPFDADTGRIRLNYRGQAC